MNVYYLRVSMCNVLVIRFVKRKAGYFFWYIYVLIFFFIPLVLYLFLFCLFHFHFHSHLIFEWTSALVWYCQAQFYSYKHGELPGHPLHQATHLFDDEGRLRFVFIENGEKRNPSLFFYLYLILLYSWEIEIHLCVKARWQKGVVCCYCCCCCCSWWWWWWWQW